MRYTFESNRHFSTLAFIFLIQSLAIAQYEDNPLKSRKWMTLSAGVNNADFVSWQAMGSLSKRGESALTQVRMAFTQELLIADDDSCTDRRNRLFELALLWGDGWAARKWYATVSVGFGLNVRTFCRKEDYENDYLTVMTVGVPMQLEFGWKISKKSGIGLVGVGNLNFRQAYAGCNLAYFRIF